MAMSWMTPLEPSSSLTTLPAADACVPDVLQST